MTTPKEQIARYQTPATQGTYVSEAGSTTLITGVSLGATTSAAQLSTGISCSELYLQNDPDNSVDILLGTSDTQSLQIQLGETFVIPVADVNLVYIKTVSSTATVNWAYRST